MMPISTALSYVALGRLKRRCLPIYHSYGPRERFAARRSTFDTSIDIFGVRPTADGDNFRQQSGKSSLSHGENAIISPRAESLGLLSLGMRRATLVPLVLRPAAVIRSPTVRS